MSDQPSFNDPFTTLLLSRLDKIEELIERNHIEDTSARQRLHQQHDEMEKNIWGLNVRLEAMEKVMMTTSPALNDYMTMKQRAIGAGIVGRWLWIIGGFLLSIAAGAAGGFTWIINHIQMKP